jgi:hypothetical protein
VNLQTRGPGGDRRRLVLLEGDGCLPVLSDAATQTAGPLGEKARPARLGDVAQHLLALAHNLLDGRDLLGGEPCSRIRAHEGNE